MYRVLPAQMQQLQLINVLLELHLVVLRSRVQLTPAACHLCRASVSSLSLQQPRPLLGQHRQNVSAVRHQVLCLVRQYIYVLERRLASAAAHETVMVTAPAPAAAVAVVSAALCLAAQEEEHSLAHHLRALQQDLRTLRLRQLRNCLPVRFPPVMQSPHNCSELLEHWTLLDHLAAAPAGATL